MASKNPEQYEPHPDPQALTGHKDPSGNISGFDYEPHPENSVKVSAEKEEIVKHITGLYSGSASEQAMLVYARESIYDDPFSYCDTRYKIAGQWYGKYEAPESSTYSHFSGIPKLFAKSETLKTEIISPSDTDPSQIVFKLQQKYTVKGVQLTKTVNSLVSLSLDQHGKVRYHKDMWNEKDYSHEGIGKVFKNLNGDYLTHITQPPTTL